MDEFQSGYSTQSYSINDPSRFRMHQSSSGVAQLVGNPQYPQSNYNVVLPQTESHTQRTNRHVTQPGGGQQNSQPNYYVAIAQTESHIQRTNRYVTQPGGGQQNSQPMRNPRKIQPEQQAHQPPLGGMFSRVWEWFKDWFQSPSQGSEPHIIGIESINMYRREYDSYRSDDEKRGELIRNMLLTIVEQVSEMKDAIGERQRTMNMVYESAGENSKQLKVLQQENETLKSQLKETTAEMVKLQQQLKGTRTKMVITAEMRGVLPNKDRVANERAVKDYFNQKFPTFTDEYGGEATKARKDFTELFVACFEDARKHLAQKMAEAKGYEIPFTEQLKQLDNPNTAFQEFHTAKVWVERSKDPQFWEIYKAVMELKGTMLLNEEKLKDDLKNRLHKKFVNLLEKEQYMYLYRVKHHGDDVDPSTKPRRTQLTVKPSRPGKKKSNTTKSSCHETQEKGDMSEVNPHVSVLEGFVANTIDTIVLMLCLPNPILPSTHLEYFDSEWVTTDVSEEHVTKSQLAHQQIAEYYSPILLTASAGADGYRVFLRGNVSTYNM